VNEAVRGILLTLEDIAGARKVADEHPIYDKWISRGKDPLFFRAYAAASSVRKGFQELFQDLENGGRILFELARRRNKEPLTRYFSQFQLERAADEYGDRDVHADPSRFFR
jgi:hypothetical protein